ncbi:MAG TPA: CopG family transcriptional regulator [Nitrospirae bacterium]|nr:CopG family transcriptional regulator [Nitrospirota bacterium]
MKTKSLTIRIDKELNDLLNKASKQTGKSKSQVAREAIERQLRLVQMESLRKRIMPFAESQGYLTDDDVFRDVS